MATTQTEINTLIKKMEKAVFAFSSRDRKGLLRKAAAPVRKRMRQNTKRRTGTKVNVRARKDGTKIKYYPGNLRRSMKTLKLKRTQSVFVGPEFGAKAGVTVYGKTARDVDGYYYGMAYGSESNYISRVVNPTASQTQAAAIAAFKKDFARRFGTRAAQQGLDVS